MLKIIFIILFAILSIIPVGINTDDTFAQGRWHGRHSHLWPRHHHRHLGFRIIRPRPQKIVFVCNDDQSGLFHRYSGCPNLNDCKGEIITVTKRQAKISGRRKCPLCF